jgi:ribonuclease P protein component
MAKANRVERITRRADFKAAAKARRTGSRHFLMQMRVRDEKGCAERPSRFGFTVTKKVGGAVVRNRIRRRLKELVRTDIGARAHPGHDYVLVARASAEKAKFTELRSDLAKAIDKIHQTGTGRP